MLVDQEHCRQYFRVNGRRGSEGWLPLIHFQQLDSITKKMPRASKAVRAANNQSATTVSAKSKGKRKAPSTEPRSTRQTKKQSHPIQHNADQDSQDEDEEEEEDLEPSQFVTASAGDAYMLYSTQVSKTTDSLLSTSIDPAFTLSSYTRALSHFDNLEHSSFDPVTELQLAQLEKATEKYSRWMWELDQGFNIMLTGLGSKRPVLNEFAEKARSKGHVVVVDGFDSSCAMADIVTAIEDIVRLHGGDDKDQDEVQVATPKKRGRASPKKKQTPAQPVASTSTSNSYRAARPLSALESRVRKLCLSIASLPSTSSTPFPPIYLVINSLDSPSLRLAKHLSLLALLTSQPSIHLISSIDHVRAPFLFPTSLVTSRPPHLSSASAKDDPALLLASRSFNFIYYTLPTLLPYHTETLALSTLSSLVPPSIYPPPSNASSSLSASSQIQSTIHVLASVTERAKRLFNLLGRQQVAVGEMLDRSKERNLKLKPKEGESSPVIAMSINS